jgi:hypothetical protein
MSNHFEENFRKTMRTKAALDIYNTFKHYRELVESGVDPGDAFLQAFCGVYYLVPPVPRPDYLQIQNIGDLYNAIEEAHSFLIKDAEEARAFLKKLMQEKR